MGGGGPQPDEAAGGTGQPGRVLRFGAYELHADRLELRSNGKLIHIQTKPLGVLLYLTQHADRVVSQEELLREVWPGVRVEPGALRVAIHALRRVLGGAREPGENADRWIRSVSGQGYRFVGRLEDATENSAAGQASEIHRPRDFVDRESEMGLLRALCHDALRGTRQLVLLQGPPGIGKTRTATELARFAETLGFEIHVGRTHEGDGAPPFWPWAQLVRSWSLAHGEERLEALAGAGACAADLLGLAPLAEPPADLHPASAHLRADQIRFQTLDRVKVFLERASRERPLFLVLDDLHRADSASTELLAFICQQVIQARLMILATHRPLEPVHPLGRVLHEPSTRSIVLSGLTRRSVDDILEQHLGRKPAAPLVDRVHVASGGNPMFVYELARQLVQDDEGPGVLPPRVQDAVWARISERSTECLKVLNLASALGPEPTLPLLQTALAGDLTDSQLLGALEEAERCDLLIPTTEGFRFVHGIVREALYERLGLAERMRTHRAVGRALESLSGDRHSVAELTVLAHHFVESAGLGDADRAADYARRAGHAAREMCAFSEAADLYRKALRALDLVRSPDPGLRGRLLVDLGDCLGHTAAPIADFQRAFLEAMEIARLHARPHLLASAAERCAWHMDVRGCFLPLLAPANDEALVQTLSGALVQVQECAEVTGDLVLHGRVCIAHAAVLLARERADDCRRSLERAFDLAERSSDSALRGDLLVHRYSFLLDERERCAPLIQELLGWALETQNRRFEVEARSLELHHSLEGGERSRCERVAGELRRLREQTGLPTAHYYTELWEFARAQMEGPVVSAAQQAERIASLGRRLNLDPGWVLWTYSLQMGWLMAHAGMAEMVLAQTELHVASVLHVPEVRTSLAWLYAACGRDDEARALLNELPRKRLGFGRSEVWICATAAAAEACVRIGERDRGAEVFQTLAPYAARTLSFVTVCLGPVSRYLGALAALLGRWSEAEALFDAAAAQARGLRAPVFSVLVDADRAMALRAHPDERQRSAHERLRLETVDAARRLGLHGVAARLERPRAGIKAQPV